MKISAVVTTYNRLNILKKCLKHLLNLSYNLNNIIVVNNASKDGTEEYLDKLSKINKKILVMNMTKNIGGSGGFSLGTKYACNHTDSNYFWLMDDDSLPTTNSLKELVKASIKLHKKFGFLCSNVRSLDNFPVNVPKPSKDWTKYMPNGLIKVDHATFVSLFISRNVINKVGLPIKQMFIWGDDLEYTTRICKLHKYESFFVPKSIIIHNSKIVHDNTSESESLYNSNRIPFYECSARNYLYTSRKYFGLKGTIKNILSLIFQLSKIPFYSKNKRCERFYYLFKGLIEGLFFNPKIDFPNKK